jgi:hypothetical protein
MLNRDERHPFLKRQEWWPLSDADFKRATLHREILSAQRSGRPNAAPMRDDHLEDSVGYLGELVYGRTIGAEPHDPIPGGDGGEDYPGVNVRTRVLRGNYPPRLYVTHRTIELHPETLAYVLVAIDLDNREAAVLGWATREDVAAAPIDGEIKMPAHAIKAHHLRKMPVEAFVEVRR